MTGTGCLGIPFDDTGRCNVRLHAADSETIEAHDVLGTTCDIGLGAVGILIAQSKTLQVDV
jgi:hypothetical protein